jgi:hypothetical protein
LSFFGTDLNLWLFLSAAIIGVFTWLCSQLYQKLYLVMRVLLLLLLTVALVLHAFIVSGGLIVEGGWGNPLGTVSYLAAMISPLGMVISLVSMRRAAAFMWVLSLIHHSYFFWLNWSSLEGNLWAVSFDWPLLMSAVVLSGVAWQGRRSKADQGFLRGFHAV